MKKIDRFTAFSYWFSHFGVEVLCFFVLDTVFPSFSSLRWLGVLVYDVIAFATQPVIGGICEEHPAFRPGVVGGIFLVTGGFFTLTFKNNLMIVILGLIVFTLGNAMVHISGAIATARASEGRLSESAIFVSGGSFGLITGRMLARAGVISLIAFVPMIIAIPLMHLTDLRLINRYGDGTFDFRHFPCVHDIAKERSIPLIIVILSLIVIARGYIGYGLPTGWNKLDVHAILLFAFMGLGKMLGGILADRFGAANTGIISCLLALPILLVSNNIMWLSLIGISLFSMTMAITLGGLFSVMKHTPGIAFGVTTVGLLMGSIPIFFFPLPSQTVCNLLNVVMSLLAAAGIFYCINNKTN